MTVTEELGALSERELEVLKLVATGATNQQIARDLVISPNTVKVHLRNIFEKLGVQSRTEATMEAVRRGWVNIAGALADAPGSELALPSAADVAPAPDMAVAPVAALATPLPPIPLPELMPHAPARRSVAGWQHVFFLLALALAILGALLPSWLNSRSAAASLTAFSDIGRPQVAPPERIEAQRWTAGAPLPRPRSRLALATDGSRLYAIGGETADGVTGDVAVYDPLTNGWLPAASKPTAVSNMAAALIGGRIYAPGGSTPNGGVTNALEIYDPAVDEWTVGPVMPRPLAGHAVTAWNGKLYVFGGWDGNAYRSETLIFDVAAQSWSEGPPLPGPRAFAGATTLKDTIYLVGGANGRTTLSEMLAFDPRATTAARAWSVKAPLARARAGLAVVSVGAQVFALGGGQTVGIGQRGQGSEDAFNEQYNTGVGAWARLGAPIAGEWRNLAAAPLNNRLYVVGGWSGGYLDTHEQYLALIIQLIPMTITDR